MKEECAVDVASDGPSFQVHFDLRHWVPAPRVESMSDPGPPSPLEPVSEAKPSEEGAPAADAAPAVPPSRCARWCGALTGFVLGTVIGALIYAPFMNAILYQSITMKVVDPKDWRKELGGKAWLVGLAVFLVRARCTVTSRF